VDVLRSIKRSRGRDFGGEKGRGSVSKDPDMSPLWNPKGKKKKQQPRDSQGEERRRGLKQERENFKKINVSSRNGKRPYS